MIFYQLMDCFIKKIFNIYYFLRTCPGLNGSQIYRIRFRRYKNFSVLGQAPNSFAFTPYSANPPPTKNPNRWAVGFPLRKIFWAMDGDPSPPPIGEGREGILAVCSGLDPLKSARLFLRFYGHLKKFKFNIKRSFFVKK